MLLGQSELIKRINENNLIINLEDNFKIEGCLVDLRLDGIFERFGSVELFNDQRNTGSIDAIRLFTDSNGRNIYTLQPFPATYLVTTIEEVNMPNDLAIYISRRSTIFRSGLVLDATYTNPGYHGKLTFLLINFNDDNVFIERGFRIVQLGFFEVKGNSELYNGNWQGGVISTNGESHPPR